MNRSPRTIGIIQARTGSTRLPEKVLADLAGLPLLAVILVRVRSARLVDEWVVATTEQPADAAVAALAVAHNTKCFRGSEHDCLDRYYRAAQEHRADVIVRLTGDNPFVDGPFVDGAVAEFRGAHPPVDYADTGRSRTYPLGRAAEVFTFAALERAWREDRDPASREHVTPYIYTEPGRFHLLALRGPGGPEASYRLTVDTPVDLELAQRLFTALGGHTAPWQDVVALLRAHPEWAELNAAVIQRRLQ
jgi:spore coat polysaccharide biosynthesis protein SpsF